MDFKEEEVLKTLEIEYGLSREQMDNLINTIRKIIHDLASALAPITEILKAVIEKIDEIVNQILEYQKESDNEYFNSLTRDQVIKCVINTFVEKIYKRKEPP